MNIKILIVAFLATWMASAQIKFSGTVVTDIGEALELANVIATNADTNKIDTYAFTDEFGRFKMNLKKNTNYSIKISYIGMKAQVLSVKIEETAINKEVFLELDNSIDNISITYKMPITVKGDTIIYNADSFKVGTEKKLEDVLEKLPGVEVNEDGEVEVEGKTVSKIMVNGKDFFDGDTKLATKNIPSNAIDKIQVLKNHSEVGQLSRVTDNQDNVVINIKLKEGKTNFWFGEITAGIGPDDRFLAHPKLFYYSPKTSINVITDVNNIGEIPFTWRDYYKFTGGFRSNGGRGTSLNLSSGLSFLAMRNNKAKEIKTQFGALNFSHSPIKTWDISGFAIYSSTKNEIQENTSKFFNQGNITEVTEDKTKQDNKLALVKLSSKYKPNSNNQLDYDVFVKTSKVEQTQSVNSSVLNDIIEVQEQTPFSLNQNLNYYYTHNEKNIFAVEAQHLWQDEDPFYNAQIGQLNFAGIVDFDENQVGSGMDLGFVNLNQKKRIKTNKVDAKVDYYRILNDKSNVNLTVGTTVSNQKFNSDIYQILDNGTINNPSSLTTENDVKYGFGDYYTGLHYKFIAGKFTFNQGVTLHAYQTKNEQLNTTVKDDFVQLLPDAFVRFDLKKSENIRLSYNMNVSFTDINKFAEGYVFNNYNSLYAGNRDLESALAHNVSLRYTNFNLFNYITIFGSINYVKQADAIKGDTEILGVNQISTSVNSAFADETLSAYASFSKSFKKFKFTIKGNVSNSKTNNLFYNSTTLLSENRVNNTLTQSYKASIRTTFKKGVNFDVGYNISMNKYEQGNSVTKFTTQSPYVGLDAQFLNGFIFDTKYTYNNYKNQIKTLNEYDFWDADLSYQKKDSKWEYGIGVTNLLNTKSLNQDSNVEGFYSSTTSYVIQPRYAMFKVKYDI